MISGSKVRLRREITELWFVDVGKGHKRPSSELKLASAGQNNKKDFLKHVNSKRRSKVNIETILVEDGHLTNSNEEKADAFNTDFASVFNSTDRPWAASSPELEGS